MLLGFKEQTKAMTLLGYEEFSNKVRMIILGTPQRKKKKDAEETPSFELGIHNGRFVLFCLRLQEKTTWFYEI